MQYFRPGSQLRQLITMLSIVGEYPIRSLYLLGNERAYKALVHKLTTPETFRIPQTETELTTRLLTVTGKGNSRSVRFYKGALPILDWLHPDAYRYYMDAFWEHKFPGNAAHRDRNHRVAEAAAMCMRSGVECRPYMLPILQNRTITKRIPDVPCFYLAKELKKLGEAEMNKTMFTRMVGTAYLGQRPYAVYNTRSAVMKWSGKGEFKTLHSVIEISRLNAGTDAAPAAILFGQSESVALKTLLESDTTKRPEFRFDAIYHNLYFIPMDEHGIRQLRLMTVPDWKERLLELLFDPEVRTYDRGLFEYDAKIGDAYVFSHLDGDLARLVRFKEAVQNQRGNYEVLCYPYQMTFIREYRPTVETEADKAKNDLLDLIESQRSGRILTGTIQGVEQSADNPRHAFAVLYHGEFKVIIPAAEAVEPPEDYRGRDPDEVLHYMLTKRLGAEVDYIVKGIDPKSGIAAASRLEAMRARRKEMYFGTDRDGNNRIYAGVCAEARVVSAIRAGIFIDLFGVESYIPLKELSYQRWMDAAAHFQPGQRILVRVLDVDRSDRDHVRVSASVKQAGENPYEKAFRRYSVGNRYVGTVSMVDVNGVFVALDGGIDCLCSYPKRGRPPRGARVTVRILGINHETNRIWGAITHIAMPH